ncbi:acetoacetate--CoA ligase [Tepidicaulis sp. LMO-SS28]|uniref:acetoacetate--CoA ligase n=1 Tax=Tepidicaulis sp. LMO-SS28 TaxID=3447455 RepID=UPI003EE1C081
MSAPLWKPSAARAARTNLATFMRRAAARHDAPISSYDAFHAWSVAEREKFWSLTWDEMEVIGKKGGIFLEDGEKMPGATFFPEARLNFAENLLRQTGAAPALYFRVEDGPLSIWSWSDLYENVSRLAQAFRAWGLKPGDRVAAFMPNCPETIAAMLAAASIGAVWSSCSPDFGAKGVLDRFGQIEPRLLIACDGYRYNGKTLPSGDKLKEIVTELPSLERVLIVPFIGEADQGIDKSLGWEEALVPFTAKRLEFTRLPFSHPLYIMFSSGTTGAPKCIVHSAGGTLLQHLKEHTLHCDLHPGDTLFYFTTCGWMMWNWLVSGLGAGATLALYDGSPFYPDGNVLFDYADQVGVNVFGTSAKFIDALKNAHLRPKETHRLSDLRMILSTGSPLVPEGFDYIYDAVKEDVALCSISGGTDIVSCFVLGNPMAPVYRGEIQAKGLGMAVEVWDEDGMPLEQGKGELVCTKPFPSMPIGFWNDLDGAKYRAAYFERFPSVWCHGDFAELTAHGGLIIHGRSDATLNPGGVRIGTAEIYAQVEQLEEVVESVAIGQDRNGDVRIVLFVVLREGAALDDALISRIKTKIREGASPRHVPAKVIAVADIPRTKSGKITELAVRDVVHGREIKNKEALANPEALELYRGLPELQD